MKLKSLLIPVVALLLFGCGQGNSKLTENKTLGKFPSVFIQQHQDLKNIQADMTAEMQSAKKPEDAVRIRDKYVALENKSKEQASRTATAELDKIIGRTVPFEMAYDHPDFEVRSAMIDGGEIKTGALTISLVIGAKRDLTASVNNKINYQILGVDGNVLFGGSINPFVVNQVIMTRTFPNGLKIKSGDVCTDQGSSLMLYCGSYDFTTFDKIMFVK